MICLSLTQPTLEQNSRVLKENLRYIDLTELRADLLESAAEALRTGGEKGGKFVLDCVSWVLEQRKLCERDMRQKNMRFIFTLRREVDGGALPPACEKGRRRVLEVVLESGAFDYIDIEGDEPELCARMAELAADAQNSRRGRGGTGWEADDGSKRPPTQLIISRHYFDAAAAFSMPPSEEAEKNNAQKSDQKNLVRTGMLGRIRQGLKTVDESLRGEAAAAVEKSIRRLNDLRGMLWVRNAIDDARRYPQAIFKCAVMCASTKHLRRMFEGAQLFKKSGKEAARDRERGGEYETSRYVFAAMGDFGRPARVLSKKLGSLWTYASAKDGVLAAPGHFSPRELFDLYNHRRIGESTKVFAVAGNPVFHSKSPVFHNPIFREKDLNAVYIHLLLDDIAELKRLIPLMTIRGLSVTVPHKGDVVPLLSQADIGVRASGSCNTVVVQKDGRLFGYNTDMAGFLIPLSQLLAKRRRSLSSLSCTVIGSGGAARAVAQVLAEAGAKLLLVNRTPNKARDLARELQNTHRDKANNIDYAKLTDFDRIARYADVLVQCSSAGMNAPEETPLPGYPFTGKEIAYDIVYTPRDTRFLKDAREAGCAVIYGDAMFSEQAKQQSELFCAVAAE